MKSTPGEAIFTYRKKIKFNTTLILVLGFIAFIGLVYTRFQLREDALFYKGAITVFILFIGFVGYYCFERRISYMKILDPDAPDQTVSRLTSHQEIEYKSFRSTDIMRLIIGVVLTLAMLFLIFIQPHTVFAGAISAVWLCLILISMMKSWTLMRDGIMLQDIKHSLQDQTSDIS